VAGWIAPAFPNDAAGFASRQLRYRNGVKLELLEPTREDSFAGRFVARFGARIHHVTLKVPALLPAVEQLRDEGFDVVDVFAEGDIWHEGFLRPSQVGGLIVQIAWAGRTEDDWAELAGFEPEPPVATARSCSGRPSPTPTSNGRARLEDPRRHGASRGRRGDRELGGPGARRPHRARAGRRPRRPALP
jgi:hypothetical protein